MKRQWADVDGYYCRVSNLGEVISTVGRKGRLLKPQKTAHGYYNVQVKCRKTNKHKTRLVHRLVLLGFVIEPNHKNLEVRHLDGTRTNNALENLRYGTKEENQADRLRHGTHMIGEHSSVSKLKKADVLLLRDRIKRESINYSVEGRRLGVSYQTVKDAVLGVTHQYHKLEAIQ
jgi:hypothetical protein